MLVQIVPWYLKQDSFDCKWQNTSVWAGLRKKGNFLPCAVKQSKSGSTEAENASWPMQYQFNFVLPEIEPCWNGDYIPHSPLETAVAMWQYIGQWDARERELWNIWMNFFIWRLFSLHALFSLPGKWQLTGPKDGHHVHSWSTSLSPWMTFGDWASYLPIWIVPWEINKLLPNLSHCILGSNGYTSFSSIYTVIGSWGTGWGGPNSTIRIGFASPYLLALLLLCSLHSRSSWAPCVQTLFQPNTVWTFGPAFSKSNVINS